MASGGRHRFTAIRKRRLVSGRQLCATPQPKTRGVLSGPAPSTPLPSAISCRQFLRSTAGGLRISSIEFLRKQGCPSPQTGCAGLLVRWMKMTTRAVRQARPPLMARTLRFPGREAGARLNVHTLLIHLVLTPLPGAVHLYLTPRSGAVHTVLTPKRSLTGEPLQ